MLLVVAWKLHSGGDQVALSRAVALILAPEVCQYKVFAQVAQV